ncbi:SARP family transcriptional regulator [Actinorhabdospora filicis]|uniref:SARP family transcriptional regulator n=1 Tax=Actinorhabdospora filicis TaxID=1785913 RepID=A0A9W6SI31_9ACTN|nr:BTAD domain-containing putative transcriptional regulator [Actinorhabdospora filicis]GLZ76393.1 SARP family transcriptional regulator [Actinorhabdospora filicis]
MGRVINDTVPAIRLLGPVTVAGAGAGPPRQACVLAVLALNPGRPVTMDALTERAWGDAPASRSALYTITARLRRLLDPHGLRLAQRGGAYVLEIEPGDVDVHRMRALAERGDAASLRAAAALWRGEPLTGVRGDWAERTRAALAAERLGVLVRGFDAALAAGEHETLLPELSELVAGHPLDEPLTARYLLALHRAGRTADALAAFRAARDGIAGALGIEPGRELTEVHRGILRDDPALRLAEPAAARPLPRELPPELPGFIGRGEALAALDASGPIAAVTGTGGIGKTALALRWAHSAADAYPDGQLYADLHGFAAHPPADPGHVLGGFLRALGVTPDEIPRDTAERSAFYRSMTAGRRLLILLDNASGPAQVRPLLPGSATAKVLLTSRDDMLGLVVSHDADVLSLGVLSPDEAARLVRRLAAGADESTVRHLAERCGRLPLALRLAASRLGRGPMPPGGGIDELTVPGDVTLSDTFALSYDALGPGARRLFRLIGLHPAERPEPASLAAMAGLSLDETSALLAELTTASLTQSADGLIAVHDLLREYAAGLAGDEPGLPEARERLYDWYLRAALEARRALFGAPPWFPVPEPAAPVPDFADGAVAQEWLDARSETILAVLDDAGEHEAGGTRAARLALTMWRYLNLRWRQADLVRASLIGLAAARRSGEPALAVSLSLQLGRAHSMGEQMGTAVELYRDALAAARALGDPRVTAEALTHVAMVHESVGEHDEAAGLLREAVAMSEAAGWEFGIALADSRLAAIARDHWRWDEAEEAGTRALERYERTGRVREAAIMRIDLARGDIGRGDPERALKRLVRARAAADALGERQGRAQSRLYTGAALNLAGRPVEALVELREALALADEMGAGIVRLQVLLHTVPALLAAGDLPTAMEVALEARVLSERVGYRRYTATAHRRVAEVHLALGEEYAAREWLSAALAGFRHARSAEAAEVEAVLGGLTPRVDPP